MVDDDPTIRQVLMAGLKLAGYQVTTAKDGRHAIELCETNSFEIAVIDLIMPRQEGFATIMEMEDRWPEMRKIAISGMGRSAFGEMLKISPYLGADEILAKPFKTSALIGKLKAALSA